MEWPSWRLYKIWQQHWVLKIASRRMRCGALRYVAAKTAQHALGIATQRNAAQRIRSERNLSDTTTTSTLYLQQTSSTYSTFKLRQPITSTKFVIRASLFPTYSQRRCRHICRLRWIYSIIYYILLKIDQNEFDEILFWPLRWTFSIASLCFSTKSIKYPKQCYLEFRPRLVLDSLNRGLWNSQDVFLAELT